VLRARISGPLCLPAVFPAVNLAVFRVFLLPLRTVVPGHREFDVG